jgi:hypothetical protein
MLEQRMTAESDKLAAEGPKFLAEAAKEVYKLIVNTLLHACSYMHGYTLRIDNFIVMLIAEAAKEVYKTIVNTLFMHAVAYMGTHRVYTSL